jgi:hypothetical protein
MPSKRASFSMNARCMIRMEGVIAQHISRSAGTLRRFCGEVFRLSQGEGTIILRNASGTWLFIEKEKFMFAKRLFIVACTALSFVIITPMLRAEDEKEHKAPATQRGAQRAVNLEHEMENMGRALKKLQGQISDASQNASSIVLIQQMQASTVAAKSVVPGRIARLPDAEKTEKLKDYRSMLLSLLRLETDLEEHLMDNDNTKAADVLQQMGDLQKKGHDELNVKQHD